MEAPWNEIAENMIQRYSARYHQLGYDVKTLGWGSKDQQVYRFNQTVEGILFSPEKQVLDIGCGFGDYLSMLIGKKVPFAQYTGWDINPDLIGEAQRIWQKETRAKFEVNDITESIQPSYADIGVMLGVLNLNLQGKVDNYHYSFQLITNAFQCVKETLIVDFLSTRYTPEYPKEDFVFYHDPIKILEFAFTLTPNVLLKHNYAPIPQKEFMLFLYK